jgi:hypothetical protein
MIRPPNLPVTAGTFVLYNKNAKLAYVGYCKNIRGRFDTWDYHLKRAEADPTHVLPARGMSGTVPGDWEFMFQSGDQEEEMRDYCVQAGMSIINGHARKHTTIVVQGIDASLRQHATRLGLNHHVVYKRVARGQTAEQALGLVNAPVMEQRDYAIQHMRIKIVSDNGGWLTYDEAIQMRPDVGDIRAKLAKLRRVKPETLEVKLSEI